MTPDQLRALINQCTTLPDGRIEIDRSDMAEIARDALRFRHVRETVSLGRFGLIANFRAPLPAVHAMSIQDMRDAWTVAIDADMGEAP